MHSILRARAQRRWSLEHIELDSFGHFLCTKSITQHPDAVYLYRHWCESASLLLGREKTNRAGSLVKNNWIRYSNVSLSLPSAPETWELQNRATDEPVSPSLAGKQTQGVIGICVWLLFLLISCAIRLADEKAERCHHSWQRYHQAGARVCRAVSYWWLSEAGVMFVVAAIDILCGVQIVYWLIIDDTMHAHAGNNIFMFADNVLITVQHGSTHRLQRINIHQLFWWQMSPCQIKA